MCIRDRLKLGENLTDGRNGIAKPRLDLLAALGVPPATYRLRAFRDANGNGRAEAEEPVGKYPYAIEVRPLREMKDLLVVLPDSIRPRVP